MMVGKMEQTGRLEKKKLKKIQVKAGYQLVFSRISGLAFDKIREL